MWIEVADESSGSVPGGPATAAGGIAFVEALPSELGAGSAVARAIAHIQGGAERTERHVAVCRAAETDVGRLGEVELRQRPLKPPARAALPFMVQLPAPAASAGG